VLRSTGIGESQVEELLLEPMRPTWERGMEIGFCSRPGEVDIWLRTHGSEAEGEMRAAELEIRARLKAAVYGTDLEELESVVVGLLSTLGRTVAVAESCTGGLLAHRLTNVPGASEVFRGGCVTYSNESKVRLLDVRRETLQTQGAVSALTAQEMAEGVRRAHDSHYGMGITGIAGPSGGTAEKPVGTVFTALATQNNVKAVQQMNPFDRETFKWVTSQQALNWLRRRLLKDGR